MSALPRPIRPFLAFAGALRAEGFPVSSDQTMGFVEAVELLGPRSMADVYRAAVALFAPVPERREAFDAIFRLVFHGQSLAAPAEGEPDEEDLRIHDENEANGPDETDAAVEESGGAASAGEILADRSFEGLGETEALRRFRRLAPRRLPKRLSHRRVADRGGDAFHMRRALREAVRRDGEVMTLPRRKRRPRGRRILLLLDVSGSMKADTDASLRFAHALSRAASAPVECFTIGTRLTRVSRALRLRSTDRALELASGLVPDWDGGTRLGDALAAFLSVPRFAGFARGALVLVVSDGLERGDPAAMIEAVRRLSRLAWRLDWLTPLGADPSYRPETAALKGALPFVDRLAASGSVSRLCAHVLDLQRAHVPDLQPERAA